VPSCVRYTWNIGSLGAWDEGLEDGEKSLGQVLGDVHDSDAHRSDAHGSDAHGSDAHAIFAAALK
jgi:hypothetical protein